MKLAGSSEKITVLHLSRAYWKRQPGCQQHLTHPSDCACQTPGQDCSESLPRHTPGDEESWSLGTVQCWAPQRLLLAAKGLNTGIVLSVHDTSFMSLKQAVINVLLCNMLPQNLQSTFSVLTYIPDWDSEAQHAPGHSEVRWLGFPVQYFIF